MHHLWMLHWTDTGEIGGTGKASVPVPFGNCRHAHHTCPNVQKESKSHLLAQDQIKDISGLVIFLQPCAALHM